MSASGRKPPAFIHVDLDGLWTLPACYGYAEGVDFTRDPVFELAIDRMSETLARHGLLATVFVVGRDLESESKRERVRRLAASGHQLANHGWSHHLDLEDRPANEILMEIQRVQDELVKISGAPPIGFRAPGYGAGPKVLAACARAGLRYDGSAFPSRWGWLLRRAAMRLRSQIRSNPGPAARAARNDFHWQYHQAGDVNLHPRLVTVGEGQRLWRLPVAVSPFLRLPLHASLGMSLGERNVRRGLRLLAGRGHPITWLLHGMDFLGATDLRGRLPEPLARQKAFRLEWEQKRAFIDSVLMELQRVAVPALTESWVRAMPPH